MRSQRPINPKLTIQMTPFKPQDLLTSTGIDLRVPFRIWNLLPPLSVTLYPAFYLKKRKTIKSTTKKLIKIIIKKCTIKKKIIPL